MEFSFMIHLFSKLFLRICLVPGPRFQGFKNGQDPGMVAHAANHSIWEAKAGKS